MASVLGGLKDQKKILLAVLGLAAVLILGSTVLSDENSILNLGGNFFGDSTSTSTSKTGEIIRKYSSAPSMQLKKGVNYTAKLVTNYGDIIIDLFETDTPNTVNNFVFLAKNRFYENSRFHVIKPGFIAQGGDSDGTGAGGPGYKIKDEIDATALGLNDILVKNADYLVDSYGQDAIGQKFSTENLYTWGDKSVKEFFQKELGYTYTAGKGTTPLGPFVIAMANSGPNSAGSQYFITLRDFNREDLNGRFTVFGRVASGFTVLDEIETKSPTDVKIERIEIAP